MNSSQSYPSPSYDELMSKQIQLAELFLYRVLHTNKIETAGIIEQCRKMDSLNCEASLKLPRIHKTEAYQQLLSFLLDRRNQAILPQLGSPINQLLISHEEYIYLIMIIKSATLRSQSNGVVEIESFYPEYAEKAWYTEPVVKRLAEERRAQASKKNTSLVEKVLNKMPTTDHLVTPEEMKSIVQSLNLDDKICVLLKTDKDDLLEFIQQVVRTEKQFFELYILTCDPDFHWTSAKTIINACEDNTLPVKAKVEYANSAKFSWFEDGFEKQLKQIFGDNLQLKITYRKDILTQDAAWESGYLALFNAVHEIEKNAETPHSVIGGWCNEKKSIPLLRHHVQTFVLNTAQYAEALGPKSSFIESRLNDMSAGLPFFMLIDYGMTELRAYIEMTENGYSYAKDTKAFESRLNAADKIATMLSLCKTDKDLTAILDTINFENQKLKSAWPTSAVVKIFNSLIEKINARPLALYDHDPVELFQKEIKSLKNSSSIHEVTQSKYSWLGREILNQATERVDTGKHTSRDEFVGKLYAVMNDPIMDNATKCNEMVFLAMETRSFIKELTNEESTEGYKENGFFGNRKQITEGAAFYEKIWASEQTELAATMKLLEDYVEKSKYTLKSNAGLVSKALALFKNEANASVQEIIDYFAKNMCMEKTEAHGSLMRRLNFICDKTNCTFSLVRQQNPSFELKLSGKR